MAQTKAAHPRRKKAVPKTVNRSLHLTTPLTSGADVKALQTAIAAGFKHLKVSWLPVATDGKLGPQSRHAAKFYAWALGLSNKHLAKIKAGTIDESVQRLLRDPSKRSRLDRLRAKRRQGRLQKIRKAQSEGPAAAIAYAREWEGTTEDPAGSNTGPTLTKNGRPGGVSFWQKFWGLDGDYWCLSFACYCLKAIGGATISGDCPYSVAIEGYARNHENGFVEISYGDRQPGDLTIWKFDGPDELSDHGELYAGDDQDIGGNTSSEGGSQSNGGGVFAKTLGSDVRPLSELSMCVRVLFS